MKNRGSAEGQKHPYMRVTFWLNETNQFHHQVKEGLSHTQRSKDYHDKRIQDMTDKHRNAATI